MRKIIAAERVHAISNDGGGYTTDPHEVEADWIDVNFQGKALRRAFSSMHWEGKSS